MLKMALLVYNEDMLHIAERLRDEYQIEIDYMKKIDTVDAVNEARLAVEAGARIIIARGYQAKLIRQYTNVPMVEICLHAQEIGLLIRKAQAIVKKDVPRIGIIAYDNMLSDISHMGELLGVELFVSYLASRDDTTSRLREMAENDPDIIIGGEIVINEAQLMGYPTLSYDSTEESILEAMRAACRMSEAMESQMMSSAQFETVLDTSFNGIIRINEEGRIIVINKLIEDLLGRNCEDVIGLDVGDVFPEFDATMLSSVLQGERDSLTTSVNLRDKIWTLMAAPIQYDDRVTGAIISLQKAAGTSRKESDIRKNMFLGFTAQNTFRQIYTENPLMKETLEKAKEYALSENPVLIVGEEGSEYYQIAEAIHNNSVRRPGPFVSVNVRGISSEHEMQALFGWRPDRMDTERLGDGALTRADHGTVFLRGIDYLSIPCQHQLCRILSYNQMRRTDFQPMEYLDVRIIAFTKTNLAGLVKKGEFCEELFYYLQGLTLDLPGLSRRPEDLEYYFTKYLKEFSRKYNKYLVPTEGALRRLTELSWKGNLIQLRAFCERLAITARKRGIDEVTIQNLYSELYPYIAQHGGEEKIVVYRSPEAVKLAGVLEKHRGNRALAAEELGISTTTLWRRMKKYGIEANFK